MKLFSWSSLFFILSLSFLWGCGYWVWLQTNQSQQIQLTSQLSLQLERSEVLLEDWQRNYRLHLDYLRADLAKTTPPSTDNVMYDPWQELDDKIQHAPWPDALLGYALLDESGRAVRRWLLRSGWPVCADGPRPPGAAIPCARLAGVRPFTMSS